MDYKNGKIYRLVCNVTGLQYIGSTTQPLSKRLGCHKAYYNRWLKGNYKNITSTEIIKNDNYDIILVESYPCKTKEELHKRERYYIETTVCVNKVIPTRTRAEYDLIYNQQHKNEIHNYQNQYREDHKEHIDKYKKEWYAEHKDDILKSKKELYDKNKEAINAKRRAKYLLKKQIIILDNENV